MADLAQRYIDTWNETDPDRRRGALSELYANGARYTDPTTTVTGVEEIDAFIAGTQEAHPGLHFSVAGPVDTHHHLTRFSWHAGAPGAPEPAVVGFDVLVAGETGVREVCGFIDRAPAT